MKPLLSQFLAVALFSAAAGLDAVADPSSGQLDFGQIAEPGKTEGYVDIHLNRNLILLASRFVEKEQPEAARLLQSVELVRVNVVGATGETRALIEKRVRELRSQAEKQGWQRIVTVQQKTGEDVGVFLKTRGTEAVEGVFISVLDGKKECVLINIVGDIKPEQVAALGEALDIDPLKQAGAALKK